MELKKFMEFFGKKSRHLAKELSLTKNTIDRIIKGFDPSLKTAILIEDYTRGVVTCRDLCGSLSKARGRPKKNPNSSRSCHLLKIPYYSLIETPKTETNDEQEKKNEN